MKRFFLLSTATTILTVIFVRVCMAGEPAAVEALIGRVIPGRSAAFEIRYIPAADGHDVYELDQHGSKIVLGGNTNTSLSMAFRVYLRDYCHASISRTGDQLDLPPILPPVRKPVRVVSPYAYRFLFNYCTFDYTMAFWDWPRWQREIDWMAMHGVNLALAIVGQEAVWQRTLRRMGYHGQEIRAFIAGPAFTAWWLMGNLEGWGGPVSQAWIDSQKALQQKILRRFRELDIQPVLQGFYGMVPHSLAGKYPRANIHNPGTWGRFLRPGMLLPDDPMFPGMAAIYYAEQKRLYGVAHFFQGDPFHEGGDPSGVDLSAAAPLWDGGKYGNTRISGSLAWVHGQNVATGQPLYHQMPLDLKLALKHTVGGFEGGLDLEWVAQKTRVDPVRNEPQTAAYALLNLHTAYNWQGFLFSVDVQNLLDKAYYLPLGGISLGDYTYSGGAVLRPVPGMGRSVNVGISTRF